MYPRRRELKLRRLYLPHHTLSDDVIIIFDDDELEVIEKRSETGKAHTGLKKDVESMVIPRVSLPLNYYYELFNASVNTEGDVKTHRFAIRSSRYGLNLNALVDRELVSR
ncbi:unnamed protein product [Linum trigynum]|uniref:Uncharacterized protein n=1 Tax=Linum trigynum TaxID=586398 RepID=A0AAV2F9P9_9ROSI